MSGRWAGVDRNGKNIEDFAYASGITLPTARKVIKLMEEGAEKGEDQRGCMDYLAKQLNEAFGNGEQWAREFAVSLLRSKIARRVEQEADPAGVVARMLRVDRATAEQIVREATAG